MNRFNHLIGKKFEYRSKYGGVTYGIIKEVVPIQNVSFKDGRVRSTDVSIKTDYTIYNLNEIEIIY